MQPRQIIGDSLENQKMALSDGQAQIWTALPAIIQTFNPTHMTCTVQPSVMGRTFIKGIVSDVALPLLVDCPVQFPSGGGCSLTFPVAPGDECLVVFSSRCIDGWWQSSGVQPQAEMRMHDLSDGFVILGFRSVPRVLPSISAAAVQIRSDDGNAFIELNPTTHAVNLIVPGNVIITAPTTTINGNVQVNGTLTASTDVIGGGKSLKTHVHTGVQSGSSNTGQPA